MCVSMKTCLRRKDRFRHRRYFLGFGMNYFTQARLVLAFGSGCRMDGAFWDRLNKAIYRCATVTGTPPSKVTAELLCTWLDSRKEMKSEGYTSLCRSRQRLHQRPRQEGAARLAAYPGIR